MLKRTNTLFILLFYGLCSIPRFLSAQQVSIDHVTAVVHELDREVNNLRRVGFSVKKGTLHANGLRNAHIKFWNSTGYELMGIESATSDTLSRMYQQLLTQGEGGVFIAITGLSIQEFQNIFDLYEISYQTISGKLWSYITFNDKGLAHFFCIEYHTYVDDSIELLNHQNKSKKFADIWVEGDDQVLKLLKRLGLQVIGSPSDLQWGFGERFFTETGNIVVIPPKDYSSRPRIKSVSFEDQNQHRTYIINY